MKLSRKEFFLWHFRRGDGLVRPREGSVNRIREGHYIEIAYSKGEIMRLALLHGLEFHVVRYRQRDGVREEFSRTLYPIAPVKNILDLSTGGRYSVSPYKNGKGQENVELECLRKPTY